MILDRIIPVELPAEEIASLTDWLELVAEPQVERYWQLLNRLRGLPPAPEAVPAFQRLLAALRAHR
ncbi:hypothetical protein [Nonomuraea sp. LPB2021202275-12-8]|uniref:hypothetical protein n=1 Tax=Nonomuraea sp. LPB2021202275-12-8 TaxID=3120159 RepID=UPI00300D0B87